MAPKPRYFYTGVDEKRYLCQLRKTYTDHGDQVYVFLAEHSGDVLEIKKTGEQWNYHGGQQYYLEEWILELGKQIDSGEFI